MNRKPSKKNPQAWRRYDESILLRGKRFPLAGSAASCRPDHHTMEQAVIHCDVEAMTIIDSWAFRFPIKEVHQCD